MSHGDRDEGDFSCTWTYIVNRYRQAGYMPENEFVGDRNAWVTRNTYCGCWRYSVLSGDDTSNTDSYCRDVIERFIFYKFLRERKREKERDQRKVSTSH